MRQSVKVLSQEDRTRLMRMGEDLDLVWNHPQCPVHLKKQILRTIIEEIIVTEQEPPRKILMTVHWSGGVNTHLEANRRTQGEHDNGNSMAVVDLVRELARVCPDRAVVSILIGWDVRQVQETPGPSPGSSTFVIQTRYRAARRWMNGLG